MKFLQSGRFIFLIFLVFTVTVCVLSGWLGVTLNYPSLFNVRPRFGEYAYPLPFTWALTHIPFLLIFGLPLAYHHRQTAKVILYFRWFCLVTFLVLMDLVLVEVDDKIPFLLFPKVDAAVALIFSLILVPPSRRRQPVLFSISLLGLLAALTTAGYMLLTTWQHRTPAIRTSLYLENTFRLDEIVANTSLHTLEFEVSLLSEMPDREVCEAGRELGNLLLEEYPYDRSYEHLIRLTAPRDLQAVEPDYRNIGEISLEEDDRDRNGRYACYVSQ